MKGADRGLQGRAKTKRLGGFQESNLEFFKSVLRVATAGVERGCIRHLIETALMSSCSPRRDTCIHIRVGATPVGTEKDTGKLIPQAFVRGYNRSAQTTPSRR